MSFDVHPILEAGDKPLKGTWYAIAAEGRDQAASAANCGPCPRVGAGANFIPPSEGGGEGAGKIVISAGANLEGPFSDLHQLILKPGHLK